MNIFKILVVLMAGPHLFCTSTDISTDSRLLDESLEDQSELQRTLGETKHRIEKLELKMIQVHSSLEQILTILDANSSQSVKETEKKLLETMNNQNKVIVDSVERAKYEILGAVVSEIRHVNKTLKLLAVEVNSSRVLEELRGNVETSVEEEDGPNRPPRNCKELLEMYNETGVYVATIKPKLSKKPFNVLCNMDLKGGGWTYVMSRFDGSQDFYLDWNAYKDGFGNLDGEFWLGLDHLYELTAKTPNELLFELTDWENKSVFYQYKIFSIGSEAERYKIKQIENYFKDSGSDFIRHRNYQFATEDNYQKAYKSCVTNYHGPWWYGSGCFWVKLTGKYYNNSVPPFADGIHYYDFHGFNYSLKEAKMMIRPKWTEQP